MVIDADSFLAGGIAGMLFAMLCVLIFDRISGYRCWPVEPDDSLARLSRQTFGRLGPNESYLMTVVFEKQADKDEQDDDDDDGDSPTRPNQPTPSWSRN